jgi:hypothetical protein
MPEADPDQPGALLDYSRAPHEAPQESPGDSQHDPPHGRGLVDSGERRRLIGHLIVTLVLAVALAAAIALLLMSSAATQR